MFQKYHLFFFFFLKFCFTFHIQKYCLTPNIELKISFDLSSWARDHCNFENWKRCISHDCVIIRFFLRSQKIWSVHHFHQKVSEPSVGERNLLSGANKFSSCRWMLLYPRARSHVHLLLWNATSCARRWEMSERVFMTLPRECFVLCCKTVELRSRKSRDLLQTGKFTSGDKVTHFVFLSWQLSVLLHAYCCTLVPTCVIHLCARLREGFLILDVVSEILARSVFVSHGHRLCRDVVVLIASIAIDTWYFIIHCLKLETGDLRDLK